MTGLPGEGAVLFFYLLGNVNNAITIYISYLNSCSDK